MAHCTKGKYERKIREIGSIPVSGYSYQFESSSTYEIRTWVKFHCLKCKWPSLRFDDKLSIFVEFVRDPNGSQVFLFNLQKILELREKLVYDLVTKYSAVTASISRIFHLVM